MKNKCLLLLLMLLASLAVKCQINYADSTVQALTYWNLNESYIYEIIQGKYKEGAFTNDGLLKSEVRITVIDSTETSYIVEWRFLKNEIPNINLSPELKELLDKKRYVYKINQSGKFKELLNWEEVRDNVLATTKAALNVASEENNVLSDSEINLANTFSKSIITKEYIEQKVIEPVIYFHSLFGSQYKLGEVLKSEIDLPIPIGNIQNVKGELTFLFKSIDTEYNTYTLYYESKINQDDLKKLINQFMDEYNLSKNDTISDMLDKEIKKGFGYNTSFYSEFYNDGWPCEIISTVNVNIGDNKENKLVRIRMTGN